MEEPKPAPVPNPSYSDQNLPATQQPPPPSGLPPLHPQNKKRKSDHVNSRNSKYFKIRAIVRDLRPHFIEVLRAPDFRDCKAAHEIKTQMKLLMELYKQMMAESNTVEKRTKLSGDQSLYGESKVEQKSQSFQAPEKPVEPPLVANKPKKTLQEVIDGSYIIGGSNMGWNFITFQGSEPVYYGVTKESRKAKLYNRLRTADISDAKRNARYPNRLSC